MCEDSPGLGDVADKQQPKRHVRTG
jgi:hypothetical protein